MQARKMKRKGRRKHFQLFRLFIINGRIKKITSYQTLDYYVSNHKHFRRKKVTMIAKKNTSIVQRLKRLLPRL